MTCNHTKRTYLLTECLSVDAHERLKKCYEGWKRLLDLCDKATDITMNKTFCVNVRFIDA